MTNTIIDTDIGGDIDDALAIALALSSPEVNVIGITTSFIGVDSRTQLALKLLEVFGYKNIPVAKGCEKPLIGTWDTTLIPNESKILEGEKIQYNCSDFAADFIVDKVMENEEITIVAIGPMTNIALALAKNPEIAKKARLVMMGGMVTKAYPEWNIACDPEAARVIFESGIPITMVGLDVTLRCKFSNEDIEAIGCENNKKTDFLYRLIRIFTDSFNLMPTLHDPLALSVLIWPELYKFEEREIRIETKGEFTRGITVEHESTSWGYAKKPNTLVCTYIDEKRFIKLVLGRLTNK